MSTPAPASSTPSERRRQQQREEARRAILDATEALLVEDGYERFSMRRLATRCGYTAPTIYHHFGDKQRLLDAVVEERFRLVLARIRAVPRKADPVEAARAILLEFAHFGMENPIHYRLLSMARPADSLPPPAADEARSTLEEPLGRLAAEGRLAAPDAEAAVQLLWVVLHGTVSLRIDRPDAEWVDGLLELSIDTALRGLLQPAAADGRSGS